MTIGEYIQQLHGDQRMQAIHLRDPAIELLAAARANDPDGDADTRKGMELVKEGLQYLIGRIKP